MVNKPTAKHEPLIKRLPFSKEMSCCYNRLLPEDGILLEFKNDNAIHRIRIDREMVGELKMDLAEALSKWEIDEAKVVTLPMQVSYE